MRAYSSVLRRNRKAPARLLNKQLQAAAEKIRKAGGHLAHVAEHILAKNGKGWEAKWGEAEFFVRQFVRLPQKSPVSQPVPSSITLYSDDLLSHI